MISALTNASPFKWRHFAPEIILLAVRWYLALLAFLSRRGGTARRAGFGRGSHHHPALECKGMDPSWNKGCARIAAPPTTPGEWRKPTCGSKAGGSTSTGRWTPAGPPSGFLLSDKRDAAAAKRFLERVLRGDNHPVPRVINTDQHAGYPPAIHALKEEGLLPAGCEPRAVKYLQQRHPGRITAPSSAGSRPAGTSGPSAAPRQPWRAMKPCTACEKAG